MDQGLSLVTWLLLNVLLPLIPVAVVCAIYYVKGVAKGFVYILGDGQICFVCTSMVATTLNDVILKNSVAGAPLAFIIATLMIALLFSTAAFVVAASESDVDDLEFVWKLALASQSAWFSRTGAQRTTVREHRKRRKAR